MDEDKLVGLVETDVDIGLEEDEEDGEEDDFEATEVV